MAVDGFQGRRGIDGNEVRGEAYDGAIFEVGTVESKMAVSLVGVIDVVPVTGVFVSRVFRVDARRETTRETNQSVIRARNGPGCWARGCR